MFHVKHRRSPAQKHDSAKNPMHQKIVHIFQSVNMFHFGPFRVHLEHVSGQFGALNDGTMPAVKISSRE
jgi:hypothetical protein